MKLNVKVPEPVGFQLAAMLDVVFLLLIFFVMNQRLILNEQDLKVQVPSAPKSDDNAPRTIKEMIINVREDEETKELIVTVDRTPLSLDQLEKSLGRMVNDDPEQSVRIRGDVAVRWDNMAKVIQTCNKARVKNVSFSQQMIVGENKPAQK